MDTFTPAMLEEAARRFAARHVTGTLRAALVAGSGITLGANGWERAADVPYQDVFPFGIQPLLGHTPTVTLWRKGDDGLLVFNGRFHPYQGYSAYQVAAIPRLAGLLGAPVYIATNAAGSIDPHVPPGNLVVIRDHINLQGINPLIGEWGRWREPVFPDMTTAYDPALRAAALRLAREPEKALAAAEEALGLDPMHFMAGYEKTLALRALGRPVDEWEATRRGTLRDSVENAIELATAYMQAGLLADAEAVLAEASQGHEAAADAEPPSVYSARRFSPLIHYLRGYLAQARGDAGAARALFAKGAAGSLVYANPHRVEELAALETASAAEAKDAHAQHLLGNVLYGLGRRDEGLARWKQAVALDDKLSLSWRNIGYAERQLHQDDRAAAEAYRKAFAIDPEDARVLLELDQAAERLRVAAPERKALFDAHRTTVEKRDDLTLRWIDVTLAAGGPADLEPVRQVLLTRHFHTWEGLYGVHQAFMDVHQRLGDLALEKKDLKAALAFYLKAFEYPKNLEVAPRTPDFRAHLNWSVANAYLLMGRKGDARPYLERVLAEKYPRPGLGTYYQALAEKARGKDAAAQALIGKLEETARAMTAGPDDRRGRTGTAGWYLLSLALRSKGNVAGAAEAMEKALERDTQPARAALTLAQVDFAGAHQ
jgi:tetratricopeptide (TPR) repeat protein